MEKFRRQAESNEKATYQSMLLYLKELNVDEKEVLSKEIASGSGMILMIFRFYLQANEFTFFMRRLKNIALTKL